MSNSRGRKSRLRVQVIGGELVIRIGVETLAFAAERNGRLFDDHDRGPEVTDPDLFALEVVRELEDEEEDGTTPLNELLDIATEKAFENGADGIQSRSCAQPPCTEFTGCAK